MNGAILFGNGTKCRICQCTEKDACAGGCAWEESDLCTTCSCMLGAIWTYVLTAGPASLTVFSSVEHRLVAAPEMIARLFEEAKAGLGQIMANVAALEKESVEAEANRLIHGSQLG